MNNEEVRNAAIRARQKDPNGYEMATQLLEAEVEHRERRNLFMRTMRKPEMKLVRAALWDLKWEHGIEWRTLTSLEIIPTDEYNPTWILLTDRHESVCFWPGDPHPDFTVLTLHCDDDPLCECDTCREALMCHVRLKNYYLTLAREQSA